MQRVFLTILILFLAYEVSSQPQLILNTDSPGVKISPTLYGIFFEDINHAADGGIYAELIANRSFEDNASTPANWTLIQPEGAEGSIALDNTQKLNEAQSFELKLQATKSSPSAMAGVANSGYWGINIVKNRHYKLSFFARGDSFKGKIIVSLQSGNGETTFAKEEFSSIGNEWKKYSCELIATGDDPEGRFTLSIDAPGAIWIDVVSLFPPTFKNRENGLRPDLAQMLADLKPSFMRFPGGCFVEGDWLANRFQWKNTIGNIEDRPGHANLWGYRTTDGLGFHEFLQMSEDLNAIPLYVVNVGIAHKDVIPDNELNDAIQDALDAIEYANGAVTTKYGAMRAANGHPKPFNIKYIEIGNENNQSGGFADIRSDHYAERYQAFYSALKNKYPELIYIGNVEAWGTDTPAWTINKPVDLIDEHYYRDPQWFIVNSNKYDSYDRKGPKIYVGEYAVTSNCGHGNMFAALGEAAFMTGMERNTDIVKMSSYAPIFVNVNNRAWNPDIINFNSSQSYGTPSYYVQKLFANYIGDVDIPVTEKDNIAPLQPITGSVGVGSWSTQVQFDSVVITNGNKTLFTDTFSAPSNWISMNGTWEMQNGTYMQTSLSTDCRSIAPVNITETSYTYNLKAMKTGGNEGFLIVFGHKDNNNFYWWNIGGWGNSQHAIEKAVNGGKTTIASARGSIKNNIWYSIRIEIKDNEISCYLDNELIHKFVIPATRMLYTSASKDTRTNEVILKVVNTSSRPTRSNIVINKGKTAQLSGSAFVLSSEDLFDENSLSDPTKISPRISAIDTSSDFTHTFPANSVTVFKLKLSDKKKSPAQNKQKARK